MTETSSQGSLAACGESAKTLKKLHTIGGKTFAFLDSEIVRRLSLDEDNVWVGQEMTEQGILLRIVRKETAPGAQTDR